ncbi:MAG: SDR family oxidoreductase [Trueperaceae bacterium]|nr:SDR family oxidoreductase [Trueperaceae bacterium]
MSKVAVISGAGGEIAEAIIQTFEKAGWQLALLVHSDKSRKRLEQSYPDALILQADLSEASEAERAFAIIKDHYSRIDALINSAGGFTMESAERTDKELVNKQFAINFFTLFNAVRAALPDFINQSSGFIAGIGAGPALNGGAKMTAYTASKGAMISYLKSLRAELEPKGIAVGILYPMGVVDTEANRQSMPKVNPETWISPDEIAESLLYMATRSEQGRIRELKIYPSS